MPRTEAAKVTANTLGSLINLPSTSPFRRLENLKIFDLIPETRYACDECQHEIPTTTPRYHCTRCRDYDTCTACHPSSTHAHADGEAQPLWSEVRLWGEPATAPLGDDASFAAVIDDAMLRFGERPCVGQRDSGGEAEWLTYRAMRERVHACSAGLARRLEAVRHSEAPRFVPSVRFCHCTAQPRPCVAVWAGNCIDWLVADLACHLQHYVVVPIDYGTGDAEAVGIMREMEASVVFVDSAMLERLTPLLASSVSNVPPLHTIVLIDTPVNPTTPPLRPPATPTHPHIATLTIQSLEHSATTSTPTPTNQLPLTVCEARPDCVVSVFRTSGSTGQAGSVAKGVLVTDSGYSFRAGQSKRGHDVRLACYLPLSNSTSRSQAVRCVMVGGAFGIVRTPGQLLVDLAWIQPTTLSCPPRMWNMLHATYTADLTHTPSPPTATTTTTNNSADTTYDSIAMGRFRARLGGRVVHASVGGAKSSKDLLRFLERCFGVGKAHDSYGATECGSIARDGMLLPGVKALLLDVPLLGFTSADVPHPRGELCVSTPNMAAGYTQSATTASTAFFQHSDGHTYYRTGDVVELRRGDSRRGEVDRVRVLDRVSNVVKLSNGLFISPETIEHAFEHHCSHHLTHLLLHAPIGADALLALVLPRPSAASWSEAEWLGALERVVVERGLPGYCKPVRVYVDRSGVGWEGLGLLAVQDKKRRAALLARYKDELERLATQPTASELKAVAMDVEEEKSAEPLSLRHRLQTALLSHLPVLTSQFDECASKSWVDVGGDSMSAIAAAHSLQLIAPERPITAAHILSAPSLASILLHVLGGEGNDSAAHAPVDPAKIDWSLECSLPADLRQRRQHIPRPSALTGGTTMSVVLLTGATGFLGSFILAELLAQHPRCIVVCIIRAPSQAAALSRLTRSLAQYSLASSESAARSLLLARKVCVEVGDVSAERFGLPIDRYNALVDSVTRVIHNAARVNFILPYTALRTDNVTATLHILRFAHTTHPPKPLTYVSTASTEHITRANVGHSTHGGYAQSKYVSERLVGAAVAELGVVAVVVRPTSVIGSSSSGAGPVDGARDFVSALWLGVAGIGRIHLLSKRPIHVPAKRSLTLRDVLPLLTPSSTTSTTSNTASGVDDAHFRLVGLPPAFRLVPVDYVARVVVQLTASLPASLPPDPSATPTIVTVCDPRGSTSVLSLLLASDPPLDTPVVVGSEAVEAWRQLIASKDALPRVMRAFRTSLLLQPLKATRWPEVADNDTPLPRIASTPSSDCPVLDLPLLRRCYQRLRSHHERTLRVSLSMQHLPSPLITSTLLTFLSERDKFAHVTHLCRSFPALTAASFRYDHIVLDVYGAQQRHQLYWQRYSRLVSSCRSLWISERDDDLQYKPVSGGAASHAKAAQARVLALSELVLSTFHSVRSLFLHKSLALEPLLARLSSPPPPTSLTSATPSAFPSLTRLHCARVIPDVEALRHLPALRVLVVHRHRVKRSEFRRLLTLPLVELDLSAGDYGEDQKEQVLASGADVVSCPTLRILSLPCGTCRTGQQALLGPDVCLDGVTTLLLHNAEADELARLGDCHMRASLTALDIRVPNDRTVPDLLQPTVLPALTHLRLGARRAFSELSQLTYCRLVQQYVGSALSSLHLDLQQFINEDCGWLLHTVFACGGRLHTLALLGAAKTFDALGTGEGASRASLPALPALRSLELCRVQKDEQLRVLLTVCPNLRNLTIDQLQSSLVGHLCRHLVTLTLKLAGLPYSPSAEPLSAALFPLLRAVAIDVASPFMSGLTGACGHHREQASSVVALFATQAPRLQYFLLTDSRHSHDLLSAVRALRQATQLRSLFIQCAPRGLPASIWPAVCARQPATQTATSAQFECSARWPAGIGVYVDAVRAPHTAVAVKGSEQEAGEVASFVQGMRSAAATFSRAGARCRELQFRQETMQDGTGRPCRQAFFDELDALKVDGWDEPQVAVANFGPTSRNVMLCYIESVLCGRLLVREGQSN